MVKSDSTTGGRRIIPYFDTKKYHPGAAYAVITG